MGHILTVRGEIGFYTEKNGFKFNGSYIPLGEALTAKARVKIVTDINKNWKNFVYADTDGFVLTKPAVGIEIHPTEIGKYKEQGH